MAMSVVTVPLKVRPFEADIINKRMELTRKIYNNMLQAKLKDLHKMEHDKDYIYSKAIINSAYKCEDKAKQKEIKKTAAYKKAQEVQKDRLKAYGFSEFDFTSYVKKFREPYKINISSTLAGYSVVKPMWTAFEKYLFGEGQMVHFKKLNSVNTVATDGKSGLRLVTADLKTTRKPVSPYNLFLSFGSNKGKNIVLPLVVDKKDFYMQEMICNKIKVVRLVRKLINGKYLYFCQLTVETAPAIKYDRATGEILNPIVDGNVGLFIDTRKITICSKEGTKQIELIDKNQVTFEEKIAEINRYMDVSRRKSNPDNFNEDGTIKKGVVKDGRKTKLKWVYSNNYIKAKNTKANIQRKLAKQREIRAGEIANEILSQGSNIICNKYNFKAAQKKKQETETTETGRILSKKKAGKALSYSAPAMLLTLIDKKLEGRGYEPVQKVEVDKTMEITDQSRIMMAQELFLRLEG